MNLLITNLSEGIHQGDIGTTSKQLGTKRLKLITKPSQKVVGPTNLKCNYLISVGLTGGRGQLRAKSVVLMNSSKIGRLASRLILLMKKRPHLMSPLKIHNISSKMILYTSCQNWASMSILVKPSPVRVKLRLIRGQMILIISKKLLLLSSGSLLWDHRLSRSQRRRRAGKRHRKSEREGEKHAHKKLQAINF
jgi:hypothetical protein